MTRTELASVDPVKVLEPELKHDYRCDALNYEPKVCTCGFDDYTIVRRADLEALLNRFTKSAPGVCCNQTLRMRALDRHTQWCPVARLNPEKRCRDCGGDLNDVGGHACPGQ